MNPTFAVYVDESGDEGFKFGAGSSDWFVLAAIVTRKADDVRTCKLVDDVRADLGKPPKSPLHFRDLKHEQRLPYVARIATGNLRAAAVLIHKPSLKEPEKFRESFRLYFYAARYLLERVSWYCRDYKAAHDKGDGSAGVTFSNRSGMSYDELRDYLDRLRIKSAADDVRIDWNVIRRDQVTPIPPSKQMGLLIVDAVAGSFFYAVQPSKYGYTEDRYVRILKPVIYRHGGKYVGYGIKFWPWEAESAVTAAKRFGWLEDYQ